MHYGKTEINVKIKERIAQFTMTYVGNRSRA